MNLQECLDMIRKGNYLNRYELTDRIRQLVEEQLTQKEELLKALKALVNTPNQCPCEVSDEVIQAYGEACQVIDKAESNNLKQNNHE